MSPAQFRRAVLIAIAAMILAGAFAPAPVQAQAPRPDSARLDTLERAVGADPENLKLAADYRQLAIAAGAFDRSIDLFEKLAKAPDAGLNVQISLALAYVDKVPPSSEIRRLSLGRAAIAALTRSIDRQPTVLAYFVRGVISLYFNKLIFRRVGRGIADLETARTMLSPSFPRMAEARIYTSLGDGYWEDGKRDKAREVWRAGAAKFPDNLPLQARTVPDDAETARVVQRALDPATRVDTSLRELYPE